MDNRRKFLQSSSAMIALPFLESIGFRRFASASQKVSAPPKRIIFIGFGWGITEETWYPDINTPGSDYVLPEGLKPMARHKSDFSIVQNLWHKHSNEGHWGSTMWLTGANRYSQPGQSFSNSISADQVAAEQLGKHTRFTSLQLCGSESAGGSGHGPGLSLSWDVRGKPIAGIDDPLKTYHRLFSKQTSPIEQRKRMLAEERSVLDTVLENAKDLQRGLNRNDKDKLDEYFQGIRDIETRLAKDEKWMSIPSPKATLAEPKEVLQGKAEIELMYDLMIAAMQTDSTRVITYRQPVSTLLTSIGVTVHPHNMSHYNDNRVENVDASQRRDLAQNKLLADFLDKLKATKEPDGSSLFDNVALAYGSNIRRGHNLTNCPTLITGGSAGIQLGENIVTKKDTPLCNAWLTMLNNVGVNVKSHGDSTEMLS